MSPQMDAASPDSTLATVLARDAQWRRLDARMLLVHPVNEVMRFLPALIGVFLIGSTGGDGHTWWHVGAVAVPIVLGLLRFLTTSFRIGDGQLQLRRGLVNRNVLTAPLDRVRTVELTSSPIHRVLGLAKVQIGTGSAQKRGEEKLELNALSTTEARTLRAALLHRVDVSATATQQSTAPRDHVLMRLDPGWVRYAPFTTGGLAIALAALAAGNQLVTPLVTDAVQRYDGSRVAIPLWVAGVGAVVVFLVAISVLSVLGYVLTNWGFTLSRDPSGRSYHVVKGLLTNRETSIETRRIRGVDVHEPLGLRLVGGGRLAAIATGLNKREAGRTALVPPAPGAVVRDVAERVLGESGPFTAVLREHGAAARRRRYTRAVLGAAVLAGLLAVVGLLVGIRGWPLLLALVPLPFAPPLARDRARRLGHALTEHHLVLRAHSFHGRRTALQRDGIIGWNLRQSWFQRRAGVATLTATTAAGRQGYHLLDVPQAEAVRVASECSPGLLDPFLVRR